MKVRISRPAGRDLQRIVRHVAQDRPQAALKLYDRIIETGKSLGNFPLLGHELSTRSLCLPVSRTPYNIIYRVSKTEIVILRIRHAAQNWR